MTFTEQYINAMLGGRRLDFEHIDTLLEAFEVDIPEEYLKAFTSINHVIQYIFETALQAACKEISIENEKITYSIEANSLASYLAVWDDNSFWNTVHNYNELVKVIKEIQRNRNEVFEMEQNEYSSD